MSPASLVVFARKLGATVERAPDADRAAITIRRRNMAFEPEFLIITVGQTVRFVNNEEIHHSFFSSSVGYPFDLVTLGRDQWDTVCFDRPGLVPFYCSLHEDERGLIVVVPTKHYSAPDSSGQFRIHGLTPGRYELIAWTEQGLLPLNRTTVTVTAGQSQRVHLPVTAPGPR